MGVVTGIQEATWLVAGAIHGVWDGYAALRNVHRDNARLVRILRRLRDLLGLLQHWGIYLGHVDKLSLIYPTPYILLTVLAVGTLLGLVNGLVITKLKIVDFAATLGMMVALRGAAFLPVWITEGI